MPSSSAVLKALVMFVLAATAAGIGAGATAPMALAGEKRGARAHAEVGSAYFNLEKYPEALGEFEKAYLDKQDPSYFFDIAECHRLLGNKAEALRFYQRFLRDAHNHPNRGKAEQRVAELEPHPAAPVTPPAPRPASVPAAKPAPAPAPAPVAKPAPAPAPAPVAKPAPAPTTQPAAAPVWSFPQPAPAPQSPPPATTPSLAPTDPGLAAPAGAPVLVAAPAPASGGSPVYKKWWFWVLAAGLVAGVGVTIVAATSSPTKPSCPAGFQCQ